MLQSGCALVLKRFERHLALTSTVAFTLEDAVRVVCAILSTGPIAWRMHVLVISTTNKHHNTVDGSQQYL